MQLHSDLPVSGSTTQTTPVAYTRIPDAVLLDPRLTPGQLRIYAVIARRADRDKATAFPSYKTIARDAHVSRTSAINGVKALVLLGYLSKKAQESGQGDPTSNLYTISGEGSQIFILPHPNTASNSPQAAQNLDHRIPNFVPQVAQPFDAGGANFGPEQESFNKKKENKTQENGRTRAQTREAASSPAAVDPEMEMLFSDFQGNIGTLTGMAQDAIRQLAEQHSTEQVRDAIREAVIYEKRSLAYVRRVLEAWRRNGRRTDSKAASSSLSNAWTWSDYPSDEQRTEADSGLRLFALDEDMRPPEPDMSDPAVAAWEAIRESLPNLSQLTKWVTPRSLIDNVLTVTVSDERYYSVLTRGQRISVDVATTMALGDGATIQVELVTG